MINLTSSDEVSINLFETIRTYADIDLRRRIIFSRYLKSMPQNNNLYCRLESFYDYLLEDEPTAIKQQSLFLQKDVYVQNFDNIKSLKEQVINLTEIWLNKFPEKEKHWNHDVWRTNMKYNGKDENRDKYPGFMIYNRWNNWNIIGI